jgi:hypothetical protein
MSVDQTASYSGFGIAGSEHTLTEMEKESVSFFKSATEEI